jgi:hypothetical protein
MYERYVLPYLLDVACGIKPVWRRRHDVVPLAQGRILEIGLGTGLNLEHYDKAKIEKVVGLDPGLGPGLEMHRLARKRVKRVGFVVELVGLSAERIPSQAGREAHFLRARARSGRVGSSLAEPTHASVGEICRRMSPQPGYSRSAKGSRLLLGGYAVHVLARSSSANLQLLGHGSGRMNSKRIRG